jgi:hypothetical protein
VILLERALSRAVIIGWNVVCAAAVVVTLWQHSIEGAVIAGLIWLGVRAALADNERRNRRHGEPNATDEPRGVPLTRENAAQFFGPYPDPDLMLPNDDPRHQRAWDAMMRRLERENEERQGRGGVDAPDN